VFAVGHAILDTAYYLNRPCHQIFVESVYHENPTSYRNNYADLKNFAEAACQTSNPDIIWDIAKVESNFNFKILGVAGKSVLKNNYEIQNYLKGISQNSNFDIGPMQINWRYHAAKSGYPISYFFDGKFSVYYVSTKIIGNLVSSCKNAWISCYHSAKSGEGLKYKRLIYNADQKLRKRLLQNITGSKKRL